MASKNEKPRAPVKASVAKKRHGLSKWEKIAIPIIIIVAIWSIYSFAQPSPGGSSPITNSVTTTVSGMAPDFTLPVVCSSPTSCANDPQDGLTGQTLTLSSFKGKVVFLEFMEPWCPHCQAMVHNPDTGATVLGDLYARYGNQNVVFISVAGPWNGATASDAEKFILGEDTSGSVLPGGWTYVYDSSGTIFNEYGVNSTPTFYIIAPNGAVSNSFVGEQDVGTLSNGLAAAGAT